jgi:hypothetical protein
MYSAAASAWSVLTSRRSGAILWHRNVPAAEVGERRAKTTLFARSHSASDRTPESLLDVDKTERLEAFSLDRVMGIEHTRVAACLDGSITYRRSQHGW